MAYSELTTDIWDNGKLSSIRNENGIWINTEVFRESSINFIKYGTYCDSRWGSKDWRNFWEEERRRCEEGHEVGGSKITGDNYHYLNYCPIKKVDIRAKTISTQKIEGFPDFWDGDYNYFWIREIARKGILLATHASDEKIDKFLKLKEVDKKAYYTALLAEYDKLFLEFKPSPEDLEGGKDLIVGKSRRKGLSYKNAGCATNNISNRESCYTMMMAYEKKYLYPGVKTLFGKTKIYINHVNSNCGWGFPSDYIDKQSHIRNSYKTYENGREIEKGFLSEIECVSFKDNPDSGRGADAYDIFGEEVGAWGTIGGLKKTVKAMRSSSEAGVYKTGMMTLFGTSGNMARGTVDFASLFDSPGANGFMRFYDIWGKFPDKVEGLFFPRQLNLEGYYDLQGNSDIKGAIEYEENVRKNMILDGATSFDLQSKMQEDPLNSAEAFSMISSNSFPVVELKDRLDKVKALKLQKLHGTPVTPYYEDGIAKAKPIIDGKAVPITSFKDVPNDIRGCPVIYHSPDPAAPKYSYKIGYDPVRQAQGTSLVGIIVIKSYYVGATTYNIVVAEYIGRKEDPDDNDGVAKWFCDYYNSKVMYENEVRSTLTYFKSIGETKLLALQPDKVISKSINNSKVARIFGCHMTADLKDSGERYVNKWLRKVLDYDENGDKITVIDSINSIRLLEELINYNINGNFDLVSALFMAMFQLEEDGETLSNKDAIQDKYNELLETLKDL